MDPVTKILMDRERARPRLLPWVMIALFMHGGAAAATYLVGRRAASRPVQLPVVTVKLVRPQAPARRAPSTRPQTRSTPAPQPTNPPPTAVPKPSAAPTAPPEEKKEEEGASSVTAENAAGPAETSAKTLD